MRKLLGTIGLMALSAAPIGALAHPGGGGMSGGMSAMSGMGGVSGSHMSPSGMTNTNGPNASDRDFGRDRAEDRRATAAGTAGFDASATAGLRSHHRHFGGRSGAHISATGRLHTNGPNAADRDFGRDRASDR